MEKYRFKLFVTGKTSRSDKAITHLYRICEEKLAGRYEIVVIDVLAQPYLAEEDRVIATPTLIKCSPPPIRRIIGDLVDTDKVIVGLGLQLDPES